MNKINVSGDLLVEPKKVLDMLHESVKAYFKLFSE